MKSILYPEIFNGSVKAFFTRKTIGSDIEALSTLFPMKDMEFFLPVQKHTDRVIILEDDLSPQTADAVVTRRKGLCIGVQVADCVPVLLFDREHEVIAAVHAGWRGTAAFLAGKTVKVMQEHFHTNPVSVIAALGPSIRHECYQVGDDVFDSVYRGTGEGDYYRRQENGRYSVDLCTANMLQLVSSGVPSGNIWISGECTCCNPEKYHSYRFSRAYNGNQGGFIGIL